MRPNTKAKLRKADRPLSGVAYRTLCNSSLPLHQRSGVSYKGRNPVYAPVVNELGMLVSWRKVQPGVPFVRNTPRRHFNKGFAV